MPSLTKNVHDRLQQNHRGTKTNILEDPKPVRTTNTTTFGDANTTVKLELCVSHRCHCHDASVEEVERCSVPPTTIRKHHHHHRSPPSQQTHHEYEPYLPPLRKIDPKRESKSPMVVTSVIDQCRCKPPPLQNHREPPLL